MNKVFKFGDNGVLKAKGKYMIPITEAGKSWIMEVDVVESDVPLLMSKDMMKKMTVPEAPTFWVNPCRLTLKPGESQILTLEGNAQGLVFKIICLV